MLLTHVTATTLKQETATVINQVYYQRQPIVIEKHGKPMVKIIPLEENLIQTPQIEEKLAEYFGKIPDLTKPTKKFRKKDLKLN